MNSLALVIHSLVTSKKMNSTELLSLSHLEQAALVDLLPFLISPKDLYTLLNRVAQPESWGPDTFFVCSQTQA